MRERLARRSKKADLVVDISFDDDDDDDQSIGGENGSGDDDCLKRRPKESKAQFENRVFVAKTLRRFNVDRLHAMQATMRKQAAAAPGGQWRTAPDAFHVGTHTILLCEVEEALEWKAGHVVEFRAELVTPHTVRMGHAWTGQWGEGEVLQVQPQQLREVGAVDICLDDIWGLAPTYRSPGALDDDDDDDDYGE